jgi:hypothetical protein
LLQSLGALRHELCEALLLGGIVTVFYTLRPQRSAGRREKKAERTESDCRAGATP